MKVLEYKNILIIKMSSLGDILHTLPFAAALRQRYPESKISWLVHPQFAGFVPDPPLIDEVIYFDKSAFTKMSWIERVNFAKTFRRELHAKKFDLVIDLQGLFKSAVVAFLTGTKDKIGYCQMREGSGFISKPICGEHYGDHVIERYLDVARYLGARVNGINFPMPDLKTETAKVHTLLEESGMKFLRKQKNLQGKIVCGSVQDKLSFPVFNNQEPLEPYPYVVLVPGARWETKKWPPEYFAKLAGMFIADGLYVVLAGSKEDERQGEVIKDLANSPREIINLAGRTSLRELAALIKECRFYVSGDTGPLHIAAALHKPLVAIYGPTRPDRTGPYGNKEATVLVAPVECAGCLKKQCNNWFCMHKVTPEMVYQTYKNKMGARHG
ncbi:MAG: glycosyltransferase family 9 protein [Acidaminococcaceae bacterium]|nr:glycosyltransferase family 9 protein [Acidaminococcaceae bacterium]